MTLANVRYSANTKGLGSWTLECLVSSSKPCSNLRRNSSTSSETRHAARLRATPPNGTSAMRNSPNVSRGQSEPWNRYELPPSERAGTVTKWAERSDAMSAIVVSYICATLRAVSKPCQYFISLIISYSRAARRGISRRYVRDINLVLDIYRGSGQNNGRGKKEQRRWGTQHEQAVGSCGEAKSRRFALPACGYRLKEDAARMRVRVRRG